MLSDSEEAEDMAPDIVAEQNGRARESYRSRGRFQHCTLPRNLKEESERLKTFNNWNVSFLDSKKLAEGGFYYTNMEDVVKCAYCGVEIGYWDQGDDPDEEHKRLMGRRCPFVMGRGEGAAEEQRESGRGGEEKEGEEGGAEEGREEEEEEVIEVTSQDVCGSYGLEIRPFSAPERPGKTPFAIESSNLWRDFEELGVSKISGPVTPYFATYNNRIKTFENWPIPEIQSPEKLAEAGFHYISVDDGVLCFHCGGGLKNWEAEDDPWVEHARWFNRCGFVILRKGREFVNEVLAKGLGQQNVKGVAEEKKAEVKQSGDEEEEEEKKKKSKNNNNNSNSNSNNNNNNNEQSVTTPSSEAPSMSSNSGSEKESQRSQSPDTEGKELELCRICYVRERGIVFLPCGHFVSCTQCAPSLSTCAVCRKPFEATVRAYLS